VTSTLGDSVPPFASITVSHGSAYTVVRATQQVTGKWQFLGCQNSVIPPWTDWLKIWHMWLSQWV